MKAIRFISIASCLGALLCGTSCGENGNNGGTGGPIVISLPAAAQGPIIAEVMSPKDHSIRFTVAVDKGSPNNVLATLKADNALVEKFNEENGTSYSALSAGAYSFDRDQFILPRYNTESSTVTLTLSTSKLEDEEKYLLPVAIDRVDGDDNISKSEEGSVAYVIFSKKAMPEPKLIANGDDNAWEVIYFSSDVDEGPQYYDTHGGFAWCLIDGTNRYWSHDFRAGYAADLKPLCQYPHEIIVDLGRTINVYGIQLRARTNPPDSETMHQHTVPCDMDISVADEITLPIANNAGIVESEWTKSTYGPADMPYQLLNNPYLDEPVEGRYLRLTIRWTWRSRGATPDFGGVAISEMKVWGRYPEDGEEPYE